MDMEKKEITVGHGLAFEEPQQTMQYLTGNEASFSTHPFLQTNIRWLLFVNRIQMVARFLA